MLARYHASATVELERTRDVIITPVQDVPFINPLMPLGRSATHPPDWNCMFPEEVYSNTLNHGMVYHCVIIV